MIPRYSRPEMAAVWAPETRFAIWLEIERHALDAQVALGQAPADAARALARAIRANRDAILDPAKIDAIERETRHDVVAFLTNLAAHIGPEARFIHRGLTSSDVLDTCLAVQLDRAGALLEEGVSAVAARSNAAPSNTRGRSASGEATASTPSPPASASSWRGTFPAPIADLLHRLMERVLRVLPSQFQESPAFFEVSAWRPTP